MKHFIESHFNTMLALSCMLGLFLPQAGLLPDVSILLALAALTFIASFRLDPHALRSMPWQRLAFFYAARYLALPFLVFAAAAAVIPGEAFSIFLLCLLPTAVSSPAFAQLFGGNVTLGLALALITTLLAPITVPLGVSFVSDATVSGLHWQLFKTLIFALILPFLLFLMLKDRPRLRIWCETNGRAASVLLVSLMITVVIARQREWILNEPLQLLPIFLLSLGTYALFIAAGWWLSASHAREDRITLMVCSGFNNVGLGVSLALLHFPPPVVAFFVASEFAWAALPALVRGWMRIFVK